MIIAARGNRQYRSRKEENKNDGKNAGEESPFLAYAGKYDIGVGRGNRMERTGADAFSEPSAFCDCGECAALLIAGTGHIRPDIGVESFLNIFGCIAKRGNSESAGAYAEENDQPQRYFFTEIIETEHNTEPCDSKKCREASEVSAPPLQRDDECRTEKHSDIIGYIVNAEERFFAKLRGNRGRTDQNEYRLYEFTGLDGDKLEVNPDAAAAGQEEDCGSEEKEHCIPERFSLFGTKRISDHQVGKLTGSKRSDTEDVVLEIEIDTAETGLIDRTHTQHQQQYHIDRTSLTMHEGEDDGAHKIRGEYCTGELYDLRGKSERQNDQQKHGRVGD